MNEQQNFFKLLKYSNELKKNKKYLPKRKILKHLIRPFKLFGEN
jgi:hypothetical protein